MFYYFKNKKELYLDYPYLYLFSINAYYEKEQDIQACISKSFQRESQNGERVILKQIDKSRFREDVDFELLYQEILWLSDGYLRQMSASGDLDAECMETDFKKLIAQWKKVYQK